MIEIRTPSRLHFGLLALGAMRSRQFGGVGLMVREPDLVVRVERADDGFDASGPMTDRAVAFAKRFAERAQQRSIGRAISGARISVRRAPRPHTGLGTGTQLAMAVARGLAALIGRDELGPAELARLVGRGRRSAIGLHGFFHGGLIVEGGKRDSDGVSPMVVQQSFPDDWPIVVVTPERLAGLAGQRETHAFSTMTPTPDSVTGRLCELTLLGLLPAVIERDLDTFGDALYEMQQVVGQCFAAAQGGVYADPMLERIVGCIRESGVRGVGQSSWGPTVYAVTPNEQVADEIARRVRDRFDLADTEVRVTWADNQGSSLKEIKSGAREPS